MIELKSLILQISKLKNRELPYPSGTGICKIIRVDKPEGGIIFKRKNVSAAFGWNSQKEEAISTSMLWRYVNALNSCLPVHVDKVFGASYNTRSALETIVAHCPNFFMCRPKRITQIGSNNIIVAKGHKCLIYNPCQSHPYGETEWIDTDLYVTESPSSESFFDAINILDNPASMPKIIDPEISRIHSQMQVYLSQTANWMNMRSWLAVEDHGIRTEGKNILEFPYIINDLSTEKVISNFPEAVKIGRHIDCMWFNGGLPFIFEVEHTTGVTSGLTRMRKFYDEVPFLASDYVIVAPGDDRQMVLERSAAEQFSDLKLWYLPYESLIELHSFSRRHPYLCGNKRSDFIKMFLEKIN